jgi:hypothetical protein
VENEWARNPVGSVRVLSFCHWYDWPNDDPRIETYQRFIKVDFLIIKGSCVD